jgi:hypothetical protein
MNLNPIKSATLNGRQLCGHGYALAPRIVLDGHTGVFRIPQIGPTGFAFVFAFGGVGHHYRMDVIPARNLVLLHFIRDGIPIYLQHASLALPAISSLTIHWDADSVRIDLDDANLINVLGEGRVSGHWGFAVQGAGYLMPETSAATTVLAKFRWLCLGDGYSNNRWRNRHFFSWPELAFGMAGTHLNACVAAGNTRRTLEVLDSIRHRADESTILIAAGADDLIEGESATDSLERLALLAGLARTAGAASIHFCAIPPRASNDEEVRRRNFAINELAQRMNAGFIDFHQALSSSAASLLIGGDYPGAAAQRILAAHVISYLGLLTGVAPLTHIDRAPLVGGTLARILARAARAVDTALGQLPVSGIV